MKDGGSPNRSPAYWWASDSSEKYWVEIRYVEGLGTDLRCPLKDKKGHSNPWYDLLDVVAPGDVVYHWNARQNGFVGKSEVAEGSRKTLDGRYLPLKNFKATERLIRLPDIRSCEAEIRAIRDAIRNRYPGRAAYYLPFQFRSDGLRMMSNYFAKLPQALVALLFSPLAQRVTENVPFAIPGSDQSRMTYLQPFKAKGDGDYVAKIAPRNDRRSRSHETLVNAFANWLQDKGFAPARNQAIDIGLDSPQVIFEAKTLGAGWAKAIREAVGQLYEYRYFNVASPNASLVFVSPCPIPIHWQRFLEDDRGIGCAWFDGVSFRLSPQTQKILGLSDRQISEPY